MLPALTLRIRCSGQLHTVRLRRGRLQLPHHDLRALTLTRLLGADLRCGEILEALRSRLQPGAWTRRLPKPLRAVLEPHVARRRQLGHGPTPSDTTLDLEVRRRRLIAALTRIHGPLLETLSTEGLRVRLEATRREHAWIVWLGTGIAGEAPLARRTEGRWRPCYSTIETLAGTVLPSLDAHPFWGDGETCRVCRHTYISTRSYPGGVARHATTAKHRHRVLAKASSAFPATDDSDEIITPAMERHEPS